MEIIGYNVTYYNAIGQSFIRHYASFETLVKRSEPLVTSGYLMFVAPIFG